MIIKPAPLPPSAEAATASRQAEQRQGCGAAIHLLGLNVAKFPRAHPERPNGSDLKGHEEEEPIPVHIFKRQTWSKA